MNQCFAAATSRATVRFATVLFPLLICFGQADCAMTWAQDASGSPPASIDLAESYCRKGQIPEMVAVLDGIWKNDPESVLKDAQRVGNLYADAKQGDVLVRQIEALKGSPLLQRYGERLVQFSAHFAYRRDRAELTGRVFAAILKVTPVRSRCGLAWVYGRFLERQLRRTEAYDVYKLGFFPAASDVAHGVYIVPDQVCGDILETGEVLSPVVALADVAVGIHASDRLRTEAHDAIQAMPPWKPGGDLLLAMLSRRERNEQPIADLGSKCINDPTYRAHMEKLMGVLRHELSRCDGTGPLGVAELLWREQENKSNEFEVFGALHQQALIQVKLGDSEQARQIWLRIVDRVGKAEITVIQSVMLKGFVAQQLQIHGFPVDALALVRQVFEGDHPEPKAVRHLLEEMEWRLRQAFQDALADKAQIAPADHGPIQDGLLGLLVGKAAQGKSESQWGLGETTVVAVAETMVALAQRSGELARLRREWDAHAMAESLNLLALRAEAAMADGDSKTARRLLVRIDKLEQAAERTAPLWSLPCLFHDLDEKFKVEFRADLSGGELNKKLFGVASDVQDHVSSGADGLRFRAPPGVKALAIGFKPVLHGDFEVTASYAIPDFTPPEKSTGCGATLRVASKNEEREFDGFFATNGLSVKNGGHYVMNLGCMKNGKRETDSETVAAGSHSGRLRFVRKGDRLHFLAAAEDSSEFRRLRSVEFTGEDVSSVRLGVQALDPAIGMEVRWKDLFIRAEEIVGIPSNVHVAAPSTVEYAPPAAETKSWRLWWVVVAGLILGLLGVGVWWMLTRRGIGD